MADIQKAKKLTFGEKVKKFFKETKGELKKVTWPTREQLIHNTGVIIVFIIIVTAILSVLDIGFEFLFTKLVEWL